jgi:hypothetical protein
MLGALSGAAISKYSSFWSYSIPTGIILYLILEICLRKYYSIVNPPILIRDYSNKNINNNCRNSSSSAIISDKNVIIESSSNKHTNVDVDVEEYSKHLNDDHLSRESEGNSNSQLRKSTCHNSTINSNNNVKRDIDSELTFGTTSSLHDTIEIEMSSFIQSSNSCTSPKDESMK